MADIVVPRTRADVRVREIDGGVFAEDPLRRVRVPVDALALSLLRLLIEGPRTIPEILATIEAPPAELLKRVALFDRHVLLDTESAREQVTVAQSAAETTHWPREQIANAPLDISPDLAHECVACGAACNCPDIGPLTERDIARIRSTDWNPLIPGGAKPDELIGAVRIGDNKRIALTGSRHSRCIFLNDDKLCAIHSHLGYDQKPTICQQFPMTLTRTPAGIAPSYAMECRSWWKARQEAQAPPAESEIRSLVAGGAPMLDIPLPIPVWHGLNWSFERWLAYRQQATEGVREATDLASIVDALTRPLLAELQALAEFCPEDERFLLRETWGLEMPTEALDAGPVWFDQRCRAFAGKFERIIDPLIDSYRGAGEVYHTLTLDQITEVVFMTMRHERLEDVAHCQEEPLIWRDAALASLQSHEPTRRDMVLSGIANLVFRLVIGSRMSAHRARSAFRVRTTEQDVVDSMVVITKMLRGTALVGELTTLRDDLVSLFLFNADSFTRGTMPAKVDYIRGSRVLGVAQPDASVKIQ